MPPATNPPCVTGQSPPLPRHAPLGIVLGVRKHHLVAVGVVGAGAVRAAAGARSAVERQALVQTHVCIHHDQCWRWGARGRPRGRVRAALPLNLAASSWHQCLGPASCSVGQRGVVAVVEAVVSWDPWSLESRVLDNSAAESVCAEDCDSLVSIECVAASGSRGDSSGVSLTGQLTGVCKSYTQLGGPVAALTPTTSCATNQLCNKLNPPRPPKHTLTSF